ncbi:MAG: PDZ domain-containing protein [Gemmatimonadota bacterium]
MRSTTIGWGLALALVAAPGAPAQETRRCPDGRPPVGELGIEEIRCSSGECLIGFGFRDGRLIRTFTTEPRVHALEPPADAVLEVGDVIVAVDGKLSTTAEASRRLARLASGDRVELRIRRGGVEREVTLTAARSCDPGRHATFAFQFDPESWRRWETTLERLGERLEEFDWAREGLAAPLGPLEGFSWEGFPRDWNMKIIPPTDGFRFEFDTLRFDSRDAGLFSRVEPPYELGVELTCGFFCGWRGAKNGEAVWRGQHPPKVARVIEGGPADRAGIREGDVLLLLDGHSFIGEAGGRALGRLRPGRAMPLQYLKGGETLTTTTITPRAPSTP